MTCTFIDAVNGVIDSFYGSCDRGYGHCMQAVVRMEGRSLISKMIVVIATVIRFVVTRYDYTGQIGRQTVSLDRR